MHKFLRFIYEKIARHLKWHFFPSKNELGLKSFVEFFFYFLISLILVFFFYNWNTVAVRTIAINLDKVERSSQNSSDSLYTYGGELELKMPMTKSVADNKSYKIRYWVYESPHKKGYLPKIINSNYKNQIVSERDSLIIQSIKLENNRSVIDNLKNKYLHVKYKYISYFAMAYNTNPFNSINGAGYYNYTNDTINNSYNYYYREDNNNICMRKQSIMDNMSIERTDKITLGSLSSPVWYRLEDISQSYFNIRILTTTLDTLKLKIDFVGATEFSKMYPEPDSIGMSFVEFHNKWKIHEIIEKGLLFHAKFKDLENAQTVRMFFITAVLGGLVIIFVGLFFVASYHFGKWCKLNPKKGYSIIGIIIIFFLYYFNVFSSIALLFYRGN